jgi:hypothetical protein
MTITQVTGDLIGRIRTAMATGGSLTNTDLQLIARRLEIMQSECKHTHRIAAPGCEPMCERCGMGQGKINRLELMRRVKQGGRDGT